MNPNRRQKWMVNNGLQQGLCRRLLSYWCGTWLAIFALPICVRLLFSSLSFSQLAAEFVSDLWFPMMMSLLVLPIVIWDSIRFSHRVAGPVIRVGNSMRRLANHQTVSPIQLRKDDFCHDLANDFNQLLKAYSADSQTEEFESANY